MNSKLYFGTTFHRRFIPKTHEFTYRVMHFLIDLDEAESLNNKLWLFGFNKRNIYSFYEKDHALKGELSLKTAIKKQVQKEYPEFEVDKVYLLTHLRTFGFIFNPVCFYFVQNKNKETIIIIEVMNTYYEHKNFITYKIDSSSKKVHHQQKYSKNFYVSPFSSSKGEMEYSFKCDLDSKIIIGVKNFENDQMNVFADLKTEARELSNINILKSIFLYPFLTLKVWVAIHIHAAILFLKRIKFYSKDEEIDEQKGFDLWKSQLKALKK